MSSLPAAVVPRSLARLVLGALLAGCALPTTFHLPRRFHDMPQHGELEGALQAAHDLSQRGETVAALQAVEGLRAAHPEHVGVQRLRQDLLRDRGRLALILHEAEARLQRAPQSGVGHYLAGRVQRTAESRRAAFTRAVEVDPELFWGWFGLAFSLRGSDPKAAQRVYRYLFEHTKGEVRTGVAFAASLEATGRWSDAFGVYAELAKHDRGLGALGMAEVRVRSGKPDAAWPLLLTAVRHRPFEPGVAVLIDGLLEDGLAEDRVAELLDVLRRNPARWADFGKAHPGLLARLAARAGQVGAALEILKTQLHPTASERVLRQAMRIEIGDVAGFLAGIRAAAVPELLADEANQARGRWRALLEGPWMGQSDPLRQRALAVGLVRALRDVGHLDYADRIATLAARHLQDAELLELRAEVRREIAFESGLRRVVMRGYANFQQSEVRGSVAATLRQLRQLSRDVFGVDVIGEPKVFSLPFVGTLMDSFGPGLPHHLAKYNKHLVLGQRNGRPVEGMILTRLAVRLIQPTPGLPLPPRCVEVVGEHRELQPLVQADLAGIALLNHYVVDMDEVRAWAGTLARRRAIIRADRGVLLDDPLPTGGGPLLAAGVEWRLAALSPREDSELESVVLDIIRWHERGHMADFLYFLPVLRRPWRSLALVLRNGLDALHVGAEMEGRAELVALALSPHTRLVLAHLAGFVDGDPRGSPHAIGFRSMVEALQAELGKRGCEHAAVRQWHRADPEVVRAAARELLGRMW
ncbi:MAG: hypothetical protein H6837_07160 [Planctomycetes bacterium]|nr:hypothetical protein [Planctomycetota bacterium]